MGLKLVELDSKCLDSVTWFEEVFRDDKSGNYGGEPSFAVVRVDNEPSLLTMGVLFTEKLECLLSVG